MFIKNKNCTRYNRVKRERSSKRNIGNPINVIVDTLANGLDTLRFDFYFVFLVWFFIERFTIKWEDLLF